MPNPEMQQQNIALQGEKPRRPKPEPKSLSRTKGLDPGKGLKPKSRIKGESLSMKLLLAKWAGQKAMALYLLGPDAVCGICEEPLHNGDLIDADHIVPRSQGGSWEPENLQLTHRRCHQGTKHRNLPEWSKSA